MKIVGVAACTVGIAHTYMAQKAIQDECAARGIECKVEAQGGLGIENELTQEDVDSADLVLESVDVGVENEDRFEQKMAEGKFLKVGTSDVIADPVKIIDQAVEIIKATAVPLTRPRPRPRQRRRPSPLPRRPRHRRPSSPSLPILARRCSMHSIPAFPILSPSSLSVACSSPSRRHPVLPVLAAWRSPTR